MLTFLSFKKYSLVPNSKLDLGTALRISLVVQKIKELKDKSEPKKENKKKIKAANIFVCLSSIITCGRVII